MIIAISTVRCSLLIVVPAAILVWLSGAGTAAQGLLLGASLAVFSIGSFGTLAWLVSRPGGATGGFAGFAVLVFLVKLPLFWFTISFAHGLGDSAMACFLAGLALVYCVLVLVALLDSRVKRQGPFY